MCQLLYEIFEVELVKELIRSKYIQIKMQHLDRDVFCVLEGWALIKLFHYTQQISF